jgi:hypothetical protein
MNVGTRSLLGAAATIFALSLGCSPSLASGNNCSSTCPVGCNISSDCLSCVPESAQAGAGTVCSTNNDCCTGTCVNSVCTATGLSEGGSAGTTGGGTGDPADGGSGTTGSHGSSGGTTGGTVASCTPANPPTMASDAQCGDAGVMVCSSTGKCVPNCNDDLSYCGTLPCEANGHCETPSSSGSGGGSTGTQANGSAGNGSAGNGSAGNGSAGSGSAGTSAGTSAGGSSSGAGASSSSTSGGASSGGSSSGGSSSGAACGGGSGTEYDSCTKNSNCACPYLCVADPTISSDVVGSQAGPYCLTPCTSYTDCELDEICDTTLSPPACSPNFCDPSVNNAWGACAGANDTGGSETGTCNMFEDSDGAYAICEAGGTAVANGACSFTGGWSTVPSQQCVPNDICVTTASDTNGFCLQACDPTGTLDSANCKGGTSCESIQEAGDPYIGVCQ